MNKKVFIIINILLTIILLFFLFFNVNKYIKNEKLLNESYNNVLLECNKDSDTYSDEFCKGMISDGPPSGDFFYMFFETYKLAFMPVTLVFIGCIVILSCLYFSKARLNLIKKSLSREKFSKTLMKIIAFSYIPALVLPFTALIGFAISYLYNGSFTLVLQNSTEWSVNVTSNPVLFVFLYVLNLLIHGLLFVNISIISSRKRKNFVVSSIISFIIILFIQLFFEIIVNMLILGIVFKNTSAGILFNIMNFFSFHEFNTIFSPLVVPLIVLLISYIVLFLLFSPKRLSNSK